MTTNQFKVRTMWLSSQPGTTGSTTGASLKFRDHSKHRGRIFEICCEDREISAQALMYLRDKYPSLCPIKYTTLPYPRVYTE